MKRIMALVAVVLIIGSIPPTTARHRSVGAEDQVVTGDDEPTVPGPDQVDTDEETPYEVGTTSPSECTEVTGEPSPEGLMRAATKADEYCGELVYNEGVDALTVTSPKDQDLNGQIGTFDVFRTDLVGIPGGLTLCTPFCDGFLLPGGNERHQLFYDTVSETGLTHDSKTTEENQRDNRRNYISAQLAYPNAGQAIQSQGDVWDMNGWASPSVTHTYVGYLEDKDGNSIGPEALDTMIENNDALPDSAVPKVCGFTEDRNIGSTKSDSLCELELKYFEPEQERDASFKEYGDRCQSPTYVCNEAGGASWRASPPAFFGSSAHPESGAAEGFVVPGLGGVSFGDGDSFVTWHWVAAPSPQTCPAQEPGVRLESGANADTPYLAHDLDSYVPVTRLDSADGPSEGAVETYAQQAAAGPVETINDINLPGPVEDVADEANDAVDQAQAEADAAQEETIGDLTKEHRVEPNADPAENPLADTSQDHVSVAQDLTPCVKATTGETQATNDPWVDLIDSQTSYTATSATLYGNADEGQDDDNNPGPSRFNTNGHVGLFTDNDNDGDYEKPDDPYQASTILSSGAYPLIWDVKVDADADGGPAITGSGSCEFTGAQTVKLSLEAKRLGYGPNTGLYQLIYLQEPTTADNNIAATDNRLTYPGGNNIYLLESQSVRELADDDFRDTADSPLESQLDSAVRSLQSWVTSNVQGVQERPDVEQPGERMGLSSDFDHQCSAGEEAGEFISQVSFTHDCSLSCEGDTVLTQYVFEVTTSSGTFDEEASKLVPAFSSVSEATADFQGFGSQNVWTDVDPLDGDPDRNDDGTAPPQ